MRNQDSQASYFKPRLKLLLPWLILIFVWELLARCGPFSTQLFPPISLVALATLNLLSTGILISEVSVSLLRAYSGLLIGGLCGVTLGILAARNKLANFCLPTLVSFFRQLPPVAMIPLMIVWFGIGDLSKVLAISLAVFFPVWINSYAGATNIPVSFFWLSRTMNVPISSRLMHIIIPASLPFILVGLRTGIATAFIMVFVSELAGSSSGLGYQISLAHLSYRIDYMLSWLLILAACGALSDFFMVQAFDKLCPWLQKGNIE